MCVDSKKNGTDEWNYFQGRNRDADVENGLVDTLGKGRVGQIGKLGLTYIYYHL